MANMGGRVLPSYTPFVAKGMEGIGQALMGAEEKRIESQKNELAQKAWMGDPEASAQLQAMDPEMAMQVEDQRGEREKRSRQTDLHEQAQQDRTRKFAIENKELLDEMSVQIGGIDDFDQASGFAADQIAQLEAIVGPDNMPEQFKEPLTREAHDQFKELRKVVTGDDWERSGPPGLEMIDGKPVRVQTFVNAGTQETRSVPTSIGTAITAHDPTQAGLVSRAKEEGKLGAQIDLADEVIISKMSAEAKAELIPAQERTKNTLGIIEQLRNHPGRKWATGIGWLNPGAYLPGTDAHDFMVLAEQASGKVFQEAYETLKGGGPITDIESRKAGQAIARMERSQSQAEYLSALDEFEQATRDGYKKLLQTAEMTPEKFTQLMAGEISQPFPETGQARGGTINNPARPESRAERDALEVGDYYIAPGDPKAKVRRWTGER